MAGWKKFLLPLLLLITPAIFSQQMQKTVVWSGDPICGWKSGKVIQSDVYTCSSIATSRGSVSVFTHNGVTLAAAFVNDGRFTTAAVQIVNNRDQVLAFDSDDWGAAHFREKVDFTDGKKPLAAETSIPSRDIARGVTRRAIADNSIDEYMADIQQTVETVETRNPDGTRTRVKKTVPNKEEQEAAERRSEARSELSENGRKNIRQNALIAKFIGANSSIKGLVYFRRVKKAQFVVFTIGLDDTNYVFLMTMAEPQS
jgi:hypothetical protein